jgi:hypothetical protein
MPRVIKILHSYGKIGVKLIPVGNEPLELSFLHQEVGEPTELSYIEFIYKQFPKNPELIIICDENGKFKLLEPTLIIPGDMVVGDILIVVREKGELYGLNDSQVIAALQQIHPKIIGATI